MKESEIRQGNNLINEKGEMKMNRESKSYRNMK
jgi:hypothetical protein